MNYTTLQFEQALLQKNVRIEEIKKPTGEITQVVGHIGNTRLTWNAAGHCFQCQTRVPEHDLQF